METSVSVSPQICCLTPCNSMPAWSISAPEPCRAAVNQVPAVLQSCVPFGQPACHATLCRLAGRLHYSIDSAVKAELRRLQQVWEGEVGLHP